MLPILVLRDTRLTILQGNVLLSMLNLLYKVYFWDERPLIRNSKRREHHHDYAYNISWINESFELWESRIWRMVIRDGFPVV